MTLRRTLHLAGNETLVVEPVVWQLPVFYHCDYAVDFSSHLSALGRVVITYIELNIIITLEVVVCVGILLCNGYTHIEKVNIKVAWNSKNYIITFYKS